MAVVEFPPEEQLDSRIKEMIGLNRDEAAGEKTLPQYVRQQVVSALRISGVQTRDDGSATIHFQERGFSSILLSADAVSELLPVPGSWLVMERNDKRAVMDNVAFQTIHRPI